MLYTPTSLYEFDAPTGGGITTYQVRTDAYSASLVTAQPFSVYSELGMTSYTQSIDGLIRTGNLSNSYNLRWSGSSAAYIFSSASVVSSGSSYDWSAQGYTSSISQENSANAGSVRTATNNIGSSDFVVEFWFNTRQAHTNPPFHMWCFGSDNSSDYVTIQWTTGNVFRFWINGNNNWETITPNFTAVQGTWYHVAFAKSGTTVRVYLNGNKIGQGIRSATVNTPTSGVWQLVGVDSGNNNDGLRKNVQDYRFYIGTNKGYTGDTITVPESIVQKVTT